MPVQKTPALVETLRRRLTSGDWSPGTDLPTERLLAAEYGVARNTIRRAFDTLEAEGRIERHVGRGTRAVAPPDTRFQGIHDRLVDASPIDILNLRIFIEPEAAAAAARNASSTELDAILEAEEKAREATDLETHETWDNTFHWRIYQAAHNAFLLDFFQLLGFVRYQSQMMEIRRRAFTEARRQAYNAEHAAIAEALGNWDATAAAAAMRAHLLSRRRNYFGQ